MGHTMHYKRMIITPPLRLAARRLYCSPTTPFSLNKCTAWYEHIINDRWSPMVIALINWMYFCGYQFKDFVLLDRACIVQWRKKNIPRFNFWCLRVYLSEEVQNSNACCICVLVSRCPKCKCVSLCVYFSQEV